MMMTTINEHQAQLIADLVHEIRPEWDARGVMVALHRARSLGSVADLAVAAVQLASNPDARTPGLLSMPGTHWRGTKTAKVRRDPMCTDHPDQPAGRCPACTAGAVPAPISIREISNALRTHQEIS